MSTSSLDRSNGLQGVRGGVGRRHRTCKVFVKNRPQDITHYSCLFIYRETGSPVAWSALNLGHRQRWLWTVYLVLVPPKCWVTVLYREVSPLSQEFCHTYVTYPHHRHFSLFTLSPYCCRWLGQDSSESRKLDSKKMCVVPNSPANSTEKVQQELPMETWDVQCPVCWRAGGSTDLTSAGAAAKLPGNHAGTFKRLSGHEGCTAWKAHTTVIGMSS